MINMIIEPINCAGGSIIEKNKERIRNIKIQQQRNCKIIDTLYNQSDYETFKNFLFNNVIFEDVPDSECVKIYTHISKKQFKKWFIIRGTKGMYDLLTYYKIYK